MAVPVTREDTIPLAAEGRERSWRAAPAQSCTGVAAGTGLARAVEVTEGGRGQAAEAPERPREVALVGEAGGQGDFHQRGVRGGELPAGVLDPQLADVLADRAAEAGAERAGQVNRVDADLGGQGAQRRRCGELGAEAFLRPGQPRGRPAGGRAVPAT